MNKEMMKLFNDEMEGQVTRDMFGEQEPEAMADDE